MTQGIPAWVEQEDESPIEGKKTVRRPTLDVGRFREGLIFPARLRVSEMQGSCLYPHSTR